MVDRLIIVNSFARYRRRIRIRLAAWLSAHVPLSMAWPVRKLGNIAGLLVDRVPREDRRRFLTAVRTASAEGYARRLHLISELDIEDRLAEIEAPTLLIGCGRDWLVRSVREAQLMAARLPHAQVKLFPDAGHACLVGDQVRLASIVNDWRRETEP
jgi:pimeloyl-ACP methyl ester carboxylesterase